jgi:recombinational DNA repair protein RecR
MAYTPELSQAGSATLRRLAWSFNKPMTQTLEIVVEEYSKAQEPEHVCLVCRDKTKCDSCVFNPNKARKKAVTGGR